MGRFRYVEHDLTEELPPTWVADVCFVAGQFGTVRKLVPRSVTSREDRTIRARPLLLVNGRELRQQTPWLFDLYHTTFRDLAAAYAGRNVYTAENDLYAINLNVQLDGMLYECHVDSNPVQGMLYSSTLSSGDGGELVVGENAAARSVEEVDAESVIIRSTANHLVLFDARDHPHYVRPVRPPHVRVAVAMNYYTDDCPERARPTDLNTHLFGKRP